MMLPHTQLDAALSDLLAACRLRKGLPVVEFERSFAAYCEARAAVAVASGEAAVLLLLRALAVGPGDEVVVPAFAQAGTVKAILERGARVVVADVDPRTATLDARSVASCLTSATRAVIPFHLGGHPADLDALAGVLAASGRPIHLIEDVGPSPGARIHGRRVGGLGVAGCFALAPGASLAALGEAGAITTQDLGLARKLRTLRDADPESAETPETLPRACPLDALEASELLVRLGRMDACQHALRSRVSLYDDLLSEVPGVRRIATIGNAEAAHHLYMIQAHDRAGLRRHLMEHDIPTSVHWAVPWIRLPGLPEADHRAGPTPVAERLAERLLALPLFPDITDGQIEEIAGAIRTYQTRRSDNARREATPVQRRKRDGGRSGPR